MAYKVRATRNDDGSYALSYGKGSKKLTAALLQDGDTKVWVVKGAGFPAEFVNKKREAIAAWAAWAASTYEGGTSAPASPGQTTTTSPDAAPAPHSGPPRYKKPKADDKEEPLPVLPEKGDVLVACLGYEVRTQVPSPRFPYEDGFAIVERATRLQTGWVKLKDRAFETLLERLNAELVITQNPGGTRDRVKRDRPQVGAAPAAEAPANPAAEGSEQAPAAHDCPPQNAAIPPVPRRPRPDAANQVGPGGAAQSAGTEQGQREVGV